jgi:ATP-dependent helicase/nuclease subunit A
MNLHKAKGLEAPVVILAAPCRNKKHEPRFCITRDAANQAHGFLLVEDDKRKLIAQPPGWDALAAVEAQFMAAEKTRLLYVAATRAKYELLVAQSALTETDTLEPAWKALAPVLETKAGMYELKPAAAPERAKLTITLDAIDERRRELTRRHQVAVAAGWERRTVTQDAKHALDAPSPDDHVRHIGRGKQWGTVVHRVLEARARGRMGESLARFARAVMQDEAVTGASVGDVLTLVARLEADGHWPRETIAEMPIVTTEEVDGRLVLREGVIDAARPDSDGWRVLDWKTDLDRTGGDAKRRAMYQKQVEAYAAMLSTLLGTTATGELVGLGDVTPSP